MPDHLQDILKELYTMEPALQQREAELVPIIQKLLAVQPDVQVDPAFREKLRSQLLQKTSPHSPVTFFAMRKFSYPLFGVFALAVVGVGTYAYINRSTTNTPVVTTSGGAPRIAITNRDAAAFGNFSSNPAAAATNQLKTESRAGGGATAPTTDAALPSNLVAPAIATVYEYVYKGGTLTIPTASVLKRSNQLPSSTLESVLKSANLGLIDLEKFSNLKVQQISLAEDKDQGYSVNVDLREGAISLYQNWERWVQPLREAVGNVNAATPTLPGDDALIATANAFLDQYNIPRSAYGAPVVPKYFLGYNETAISSRMGFVQSVQVVYPLVVESKPVVNENGYPMGLTVDIDLNLNRVVSVNNLTGLSYEASAYPMVTETATILDMVKRGGMYGVVPVADQSVKRVQVEVGAPTLGFYPSRYQIEQTNTEYLIPALVFPITKAPQGEQLYRTAIVVPLVIDLLDQQVKIMPAVDIGTGTSTSTPASDGGAGAAEVMPEAQ